MKIGIIGCGSMGGAFAKSLSKKHKVVVYDRNLPKMEHLQKEAPIQIAHSVEELIKQCQILFIAIKPHNFSGFVTETESLIKPEHIVVSMLSGVKIQLFEQQFPKVPILRVMPNLAITTGFGVIGITGGDFVTEAQREQIAALLLESGSVIWIEESKFEALTGLTGSAPAFILVLIEAFIEGGVYMGFSKELSRDLVLQTFFGTVALLKESGKHPDELKMMIASPGGTTIEGLKVLEGGAIRAIIMSTLEATRKKGQEMHKLNP